ncbi:HlyD family secretion protein [Synechococcus sp. GFB01]|uniref:HlyD family secretion protein n=1 Tax=Synechococcus sp. GFB01 TaxID=1662190 RepID=UPI0013792155|nr:HlyD family secretion protein [Synechococcus sp. GFB01]
MLAGVLGFSVLGWWVAHWGIEETDNAQVEAHLVDIASRVPGTIAQVAVEENQAVHRGELLVLLDPRDARIRLLQAEADLQEARRQASALQAQARASLSGAAAAADVAVADQQVAAAELERAQADLRRLEFLLRQGVVSRQEVDRARAVYAQARGQLTRSQASALQSQASRRQVRVEGEKAAAAQARIRQLEAALDEAQLQLGYQRILAPGDGRIGSLTAEPGRQVQPGQPLMTLVAPQPWVEANFKETQMDALRPGQAAEVSIDAFPGRRLRGHVVSVAPAAGSRFALLPPDNATGNFTKVVQRVTARIALDGVPPPLAARLVPGLSATVRVRRP